MKLQPTFLFAWLGGIAVLAAIAAGFLVIGTPNEIRMRRVDQTRARDLAAIANQVAAYRRTHQNLPQSLSDLVPSSPSYVLTPRTDPLGLPYEYSVKNEYSYELCAEFFGPAEDAANSRDETLFSKHGRGRQCFTLEERPPVHR
jgi:hypothetical protein